MNEGPHHLGPARNHHHPNRRLHLKIPEPKRLQSFPLLMQSFVVGTASVD
jgi:hypothetical protein